MPKFISHHSLSQVRKIDLLIIQEGTQEDGKSVASTISETENLPSHALSLEAPISVTTSGYIAMPPFNVGRMYDLPTWRGTVQLCPITTTPAILSALPMECSFQNSFVHLSVCVLKTTNLKIQLHQVGEALDFRTYSFHCGYQSMDPKVLSSQLISTSEFFMKIITPSTDFSQQLWAQGKIAFIIISVRRLKIREGRNELLAVPVYLLQILNGICHRELLFT